MAYINCGAYIHGERAKTKKALKDAVKNNVDKVKFDRTSVLDGNPPISGGQQLRDALANGDKLQVVGPDPYNNRRWYATVKLGTRGIVVE